MIWYNVSFMIYPNTFREFSLDIVWTLQSEIPWQSVRTEGRAWSTDAGSVRATASSPRSNAAIESSKYMFLKWFGTVSLISQYISHIFFGHRLDITERDPLTIAAH